MLVGMFISGFINVGALGQFPPAIRGMHGPAMAATIIAMYSLIGIFGKILVGWINDKYGLMASTAFGCTAFVLIFVFMLMGENVTMLYIMAICFGFGTAIGTVTPPLVTADIFGSQKYGEAYGLSNSAVQVGLCTGSVFVAYIFDTMGSYNPAWIILGVLTVLNFLCWAGALILSRKYMAK
jgi:MFS family permease